MKDLNMNLLIPFIGAFISRWHGGGLIHGTPKAIKALVWSFPFALVVYLNTGAGDTKSIMYSAFTLISCMVFKNTGHGGGMDLGYNPKEPNAGRKPEKIEYLILWLHGRIPTYWYDFTLLAIIGLFSTIAPSIVIGMDNLLLGMIIALSGAFKAVAYAIGWKLLDMGKIQHLPYNFNHATAIGELLTGFFAYIPLTIMLL